MAKKDLGVVPGEKVGQAWNAGKPLMQKK